MRNKLVSALVVTSFLVPAAQAAEDAKCALKLGAEQIYSNIARQKGIEFFVVGMSPAHFLELERAQRATGRDSGAKVSIKATGSGIVRETPEGPSFLSSDARFRHQMQPLLRQHSGYYAHTILSNGDTIADGTRYRNLKQWKVGLVFPVELLDSLSFALVSTHNVQSRRMAVGTGRGAVAFSSDQGPSAFAKAMDEMLKLEFESGPRSFDANPHFEFHFDDAVSLGSLAFLWIPEPLQQWMTKHKASLENASYEDIEAALERNLNDNEYLRNYQIAVRIRSEPCSDPRFAESYAVNPALVQQYRERLRVVQNVFRPEEINHYAHVAPLPLVDGVGNFKPRARLASWHDVMPDWAQIAALWRSASSGSGQLLLPGPSR